MVDNLQRILVPSLALVAFPAGDEVRHNRTLLIVGSPVLQRLRSELDQAGIGGQLLGLAGLDLGIAGVGSVAIAGLGEPAQSHGLVAVLGAGNDVHQNGGRR